MLNIHNYQCIKELNGGDFSRYEEKCDRCNKRSIATYQDKIHVINREVIK